MIQFNLLPDVKKDYVKARKMKRLIFSLSVLFSVGSVVVVVLLFTAVQVGQRGHINGLTGDIEEATQTLQETEDLNKMLTIQNQLSLLPQLHETKPQTSRVFNYVEFISPETLTVRSLNVTILDSSMILEGEADAIATINRFVDNIKATRFTTQNNPDDRLQTFSNVATELSGTNDRATFRINLTFDPLIFNNTESITLFLADKFMNPDQEGGN